MKKYKICIVPLRVGSGIKIKILEAFIYGNPVVTTSVGAEGISFFNEHRDGVQDDPSSFAEEIVHLFRKDDYFNEVREKQYMFARKNLTLEANREKINRLLAKLTMSNE
jgi:glycosyltransferase involved in cell wall biosynthesis